MFQREILDRQTPLSHSTNITKISLMEGGSVFNRVPGIQHGKPLAAGLQGSKLYMFFSSRNRALNRRQAKKQEISVGHGL